MRNDRAANQMEVLAAMHSLPPGADRKRIRSTCRRYVGAAMMERLVELGLVQVCGSGYELTAKGHEQAARARMIHHVSTYTPEMGKATPVPSVWERIPQADVEHAMANRRSPQWMRMKFDVSEAGLKMLLEHYGLLEVEAHHEEVAIAGRAQSRGVAAGR